MGYAELVTGVKLNDRRSDYKEYLQTEHWQQTRKEALRRANYRCQLCGNRGKLNIHHNNYENLYNEKDSDVIVLCGDCHEKFHNLTNG